jgi:hypothetical protein
MFNIFGNSGNSKEYNVPKTDEFCQSVPIEHPKHSYTVGVNESGETVLKLQTESGTTTMTLNQSGTISLIRLLEATLPIESEE